MTVGEPRGDQGRGSGPSVPLDLAALRRRLGVRSAEQTSKFIAHAHLIDACAKPGCPVCGCLGELTVQALGALLYDQVTDRETRERLDRSAGFCAWHGQLIGQGGHSALGTAIVYESVLRRSVSRLRDIHAELTARVSLPWWSSWSRHRPSPAPATRCLLCVALAGSEANYLRTALDFSGDQEFRAAYAGSAGLCLPHLDLALAWFPRHRGRAGLVATTLPKIERLGARLARFVDKHDYRAEAAFTPEEAAAWTDAVRVVTGAPGLFGHQIPRNEAPPGRGSGVATTAPPGEDALAAAQTRLDAFAFENRRLTERLAELTRETGDESSRAAGLDYRLRLLAEDRRVLELNLAGERGAARTWERQVRELEAEVAALRRQLGLPDPVADRPGSGQSGPSPA